MKEYNGYKYSKQGETYTVYNKEGKAWIVGFKTEEEAKSQIDDLVNQEENVQNNATLEDRVSAVEDAINSILGF